MKYILITGCGSGFGELAAIRLAKRGHFVYATTHSEYQCYKLNKIAKDLNINLKSFKMDIRIKEDREKVNDLYIDVLINNAAIGDSGSVSEVDVNKFRNTFETNVFSSIELTQLVLKQMIKRKKGKIIFISSLAGKEEIPFLSPYCATKFALEAIVPSLDKELAYLDVDIPVSLIEPGAFSTGFNEKNISKQFKYINSNSYFKNISKKIMRKQYSYFKIISSSNINSVIEKYIKAVEDDNPKLRYTVPKIQSSYIKIKNSLFK